MIGGAPQVLSISSQVVFGHVGQSNTALALNKLGVEVWQLPTCVLAHVPGRRAHLGPPAGFSTAAASIEAIIMSLKKQEYLANVDVVFTGFFKSAEQVDAAEKAVRIAKEANPNVTFFCDPIIGDDHTGRYVADGVKEAIIEKLLPLADVLTPNFWEAKQLTDMADQTDVALIEKAMRNLCPSATIVITSIPGSTVAKIGVSITEKSGLVSHVESSKRETAVHGTGDLFSGLFCGFLINSVGAVASAEKSIQVMETVFDFSENNEELLIIKAFRDLAIKDYL